VIADPAGVISRILAAPALTTVPSTPADA